MSNSRGGFFSLNRLLGKKQKHEKNLSSSPSRSSAQTLTRSTTNLEEISPQNKIAPLITIPNAPFEQSFRITVYLPLGQLYVTRIGAKTKLCELLDTICINKLLDPNKFEFRHPADDTQVFDLSFTVGEVGLNEIKLVQNNSNKNTSVRYRTSNNQENRLAPRPHTMSSVSPYSSTNSLNSSDSSGIMMNQRLNNSYIPSASGRKKRVAPRPPSQNSISEDPERKWIGIEIDATNEVEPKRSNLSRQNFHMSSPNLATNNNIMQNSTSSNCLHTNCDERCSGNIQKNNKRVPMNRPLSVQLSTTTSEDHVLKRQSSEKSNSPSSRNHSRTSSETSDTAKDSNFLGTSQLRKRPPIGKKKAPAPPPRISTLSNGRPIATPRNVVPNLKEESIEYESIAVKDTKSAETQLCSEISPIENSTNVSKIMLNMIEVAVPSSEIIVKRIDNDDEHKEKMCSNQINESTQKYVSNEIPSVSRTQITYSLEPRVSEPEGKKVSVIDLKYIDHNDISKQINDILDEAVKVNEATLNAENQRKNNENIETCEKTNEINNNNPPENVNWNCNKYECKTEKLTANTDSEKPETILADIPIQPILNETRTFNFNEYHDNSLPTSTISTLNTTETLSTGPESLITSDIEDGYKGNVLEKKRKVEVTSKEEFIESQFEFLREHLDSKTNIDSDEKKSLDFVKKCDIISSTMIANKVNETFKISPTLDKTDVINELTQIINCRLDTFIKPSNESSCLDTGSKRSSLSNFHIGSYTNGSHVNNEQTITSNISTIEEPFFEQNALEINEWTQNDVTKSLENNVDTKSQQADTFVIPKLIGRSMSFHSTFENILDYEQITKNSNVDTILSTTFRSNSYLSLNEMSEKDENNLKNHSMVTPRKKSSSELCIADTPSLQSIEVLKSILNRSIVPNSESTVGVERTEIKPATEKAMEMNNDNQRIVQTNEKKLHTTKLESTERAKTWKYQGPPSINFSTWGERPKSMVHIKSDNDYIFGGNSKIAELQRRFGGVEEENGQNAKSSISLSSKKLEKQIDGSTCKLPIVRGVEYKKNVQQLNKNTTDLAIGDTLDSSQQSTSFRPSYEVSRIVSEKSFLEKAGASNIARANQTTSTVPNKSHNNNISKTGYMQRIQSFRGLSKAQSANDTIDEGHERESAKKLTYECSRNRIFSNEPEKPIFTQFTLRKTGLKEKMLDEYNSKNSISISDVEINDKIISLHEANVKANPNPNPIPTAPKLPSILKKPASRTVSMGNIQPDPRNQLLDSIRNFNRDTLKRNIIY